MSATKRVNTVTLIRGSLLSVRIPRHLEKGSVPSEPVRFERGKPVVIEDKDWLAWFEGQYEEIEDGEGEVYEKPTFRVDRNVPMPGEDEPTRRPPKKLAADRQIKRRRTRA